jgi:hypothetical protein
MQQSSFSYPHFDAGLVVRRLLRPERLPGDVTNIVLGPQRGGCRLAHVV